jgi:hypothetical protein
LVAVRGGGGDCRFLLLSGLGWWARIIARRLYAFSEPFVAQ